MKKLVVIGEALIDFIPLEKGNHLKDVNLFEKVAGGAPANVAGACSKLGCQSIFLTKLGKDPFGDYIIDVLNKHHIDTNYINQTEEYDTSLAFVSLNKDGNRDFKFYRKTAADLTFKEEDIPDHILDDCGIVHFGSVDLISTDMKKAHLKLIQMAKENNIIVSFDPNLRLALWDDHALLKSTVLDFFKYTDILKLSDEELFFITGFRRLEEALDYLLSFGIKMIIYTKGSNGASLYYDNKLYKVDGIKVDVKDTTGAGDAFIGSFLFRLLNDHIDNLNQLNYHKLKNYLNFANLYAASSCINKGALASYYNLEQFKEFLFSLKM